MKKLLFVVASLFLLAGAANAQVTTTERVAFAWDPPPFGEGVGNPAVSYVVEVEEDGVAIIPTSTVDTEYFEFDANLFSEYRIRVAGVDAGGAQGAFSVWSDPLTASFGPPLAPGKPYRVPLAGPASAEPVVPEGVRNPTPEGG